MKLLYSVPVGAENIEKIDVKQVEILNQLYEESALTIGMEAIPDEEFFNILYNWLIGMMHCRKANLNCITLQESCGISDLPAK